MEFKLAAKFIGLILGIYIILISINWYRRIDNVEVVKEDITKSISPEELMELDKDYEVVLGQDYEWVHYETVKYTRGNIPFCFNKEIISKTEPKLLLRRR